MKLTLNRNLLKQMPAQVGDAVKEWATQYHKRTISVNCVKTFSPGEDAKVTMVNLLTNASQTEHAAGEFAGLTRLSPCATIPLPYGCMAVVTGFYCGTPYLELYTSAEQKPGAVQLQEAQ